MTVSLDKPENKVKVNYSSSNKKKESNYKLQEKIKDYVGNSSSEIMK